MKVSHDIRQVAQGIGSPSHRDLYGGCGTGSSETDPLRENAVAVLGRSITVFHHDQPSLGSVSRAWGAPSPAGKKRVQNLLEHHNGMRDCNWQQSTDKLYNYVIDIYRFYSEMHFLTEDRVHTFCVSSRADHCPFPGIPKTHQSHRNVLRFVSTCNLQCQLNRYNTESKHWSSCYKR